jgi:hypothetical protein
MAGPLSAPKARPARAAEHRNASQVGPGDGVPPPAVPTCEAASRGSVASYDLPTLWAHAADVAGQVVPAGLTMTRTVALPARAISQIRGRASTGELTHKGPMQGQVQMVGLHRETQAERPEKLPQTDKADGEPVSSADAREHHTERQREQGSYRPSGIRKGPSGKNESSNRANYRGKKTARHEARRFVRALGPNLHKTSCVTGSVLSLRPRQLGQGDGVNRSPPPPAPLGFRWRRNARTSATAG